MPDLYLCQSYTVPYIMAYTCCLHFDDGEVCRATTYGSATMRHTVG